MSEYNGIEGLPENVLARKPSLMLIDGMALLFRAYYATALKGYIRRTAAGVPTNGIYGFVRYMWDAVQQFDPTHIACCWDMGGRTFRTEQFESYKGNRSAAPDDLIPQFDLVKEVVEAMNIPNIGLSGYEADDCIGTIAKRCVREHQMDVQILSGDNDLLQLTEDQIKVIIMKKGYGNYQVYTPQFLMEEKGLTPSQIIDMKGLMGDASDNYPGVKGIGEKTAIKLVQEYGDIDGILANLDQLTKSVRSKIENDLDMLHMSRKLAEIHCEVPIEYAIDLCEFKLDDAKIAAKFEELEMSSLTKMVGADVFG
ncbi:5'-3' exonuclease H3TH domain-containing protein [Saccharibacillus sp. JS10]|uniref:5'-3' exonuclease n=1 Tax=Saccharibacillus sp. JS10 TaxID=2950552 RepID=UPI00210C1A14|nr:5'-3' exonuclease H3TH domain-containing protein [Saccharibacillus sp. JS10]MCQ4086867.1 5'-3' exonuclease [Saccharibacillus sp. JS10]